MNPGATTAPAMSIVRAEGSVIAGAIRAMVSPLSATSARVPRAACAVNDTGVANQEIVARRLGSSPLDGDYPQDDYDDQTKQLAMAAHALRTAIR